MNEDRFNIEMRKFLKTVGVTSQREIETAVRAAIDAGKLQGNEKLSARVVLDVKELDLHHEVKGTISLG